MYYCGIFRSGRSLNRVRCKKGKWMWKKERKKEKKQRGKKKRRLVLISCWLPLLSVSALLLNMQNLLFEHFLCDSDVYSAVHLTQAWLTQNTGFPKSMCWVTTVSFFTITSWRSCYPKDNLRCWTWSTLGLEENWAPLTLTWMKWVLTAGNSTW